MFEADTIAKKMLKIIEEAGKRGITRREIEKAIKKRGCDCENWINTFLEADIIEVCGKTRSGAQLLRMVKK